MHQLIQFFAANPYNISAKSIGVPTSTATLADGLANALKLLFGVAGSLALVFLIVGGIQYAYSAGNAKRISTARETILYAIVGMVIAIAAYAIVNYIAGTFVAK